MLDEITKTLQLQNNGIQFSSTSHQCGKSKRAFAKNDTRKLQTDCQILENYSQHSLVKGI